MRLASHGIMALMKSGHWPHFCVAFEFYNWPKYQAGAAAISYDYLLFAPVFFSDGHPGLDNENVRSIAKIDNFVIK